MYYLRGPEILNMKTSLIHLTPFFFLFLFILIICSNSLFSQDYQKMTEINEKMILVLAELDSCKNNLDCMLIASKKLEKLTKELEEAQKTKTTKQDENPSNTNPQIGDQTKIPPSSDSQSNSTPPFDSQTRFPPPFDSITDLWIEHMIVSVPYPGKPVDCVKINTTREKLLDQISKIYEKEKDVTGLNFPINFSNCNEASVITEVQGEINPPYGMYLKYEIQIEETPFWIVTNDVFLDDENIRYGEKVNYRLSEASSVVTKVGKYSGWILDNSVDPPAELPLNEHALLSEKNKDKVWEIGLGSDGTDIIYSEIIPAGSNLKGETNKYLLVLRDEPIRFYPKGDRENYIETYGGTMFEKLSKEDILSALKQGKYNSYYNETDMTGMTSVSKEITIIFEPNKCDAGNSAGNGAIVLSGDCIDHGGNVIASKSSFLVNNKLVAHIGDEVLCKKHGSTKIVASKKLDVLNGDKQIARIGDKTECGATIKGGSKNTYAGIK
jgi:uncharacterized Zn-binding protein involved in type VI secretion